MRSTPYFWRRIRIQREKIQKNSIVSIPEPTVFFFLWACVIRLQLFNSVEYIYIYIHMHILKPSTRKKEQNKKNKNSMGLYIYLYLLFLLYFVVPHLCIDIETHIILVHFICFFFHVEGLTYTDIDTYFPIGTNTYIKERESAPKASIEEA